MYRIEADRLIPGSGDPLADAVVVLDGATIAYAGKAADAPATPGADVVRAAVVMPGMWDCHSHVTGLSAFSGAALAFTPMAARGARAVGDLQAALAAGVTSVREVGGLGVYLADLVADGTIAGPSIYPAGAVLSITGGHGDLHNVPLPWISDLTAAGAEVRLCDGPADCAKAVREQLRRNAKVIKVCASGGVISVVDRPDQPQFTANELAAMVEVAGMAGRAVAAHAHGKRTIIGALEAGVHTIEHGTFLDEECCDAMRETGAILVTTHMVFESLAHSSAYPEWIRRELADMGRRHAEAIALAHERGVRIASGTDIVFSATHDVLPWGQHGREIPLLAECGLTPLAAIEAVTATAPHTLGPQAPQSGVLAAGYDADVITLDADPLTDLSVLAQPEHVTGVWRAGVRRKSGGTTEPTERGAR